MFELFVKTFMHIGFSRNLPLFQTYLVQIARKSSSRPVFTSGSCLPHLGPLNHFHGFHMVTIGGPEEAYSSKVAAGKWFRRDFRRYDNGTWGRFPKGVRGALSLLSPTLGTENAAALRDTAFEVHWIPFDWALNDLSPAPEPEPRPEKKYLDPWDGSEITDLPE